MPGCRCERSPSYCAVYPPSITNSLPVTNDASSEARYSTPYAISSGVPTRPMGTRWSRSSRSAGLRSASPSCRMGVSTPPGCTELHRMWSRACWIAVILVNNRTAPLEAMYAGGPNGHQARDRRDVHNRAATSPARGRNGVLRAQKHPLRIHRHDAVPVGFSRVLDPLAEYNTRIIHQDIQFAIAVDRRAHGLDPIGLVGHIQIHVGRLTAPSADRLLHLLPRGVQDVAHHHAGAFLREEPRFSRPLA